MRQFITNNVIISLFGLLAVVTVALLPLFLEADEDIAKTFITKGDDCLKKDEIGRALEFYQKALKESPDLPEVHFKLGEVFLKQNEKIKGRISFKKCITLIDKISKPSSGLKDLRKKAEANLGSLEASRRDGKIVEQEYIKELLVFAKRIKGKDNSFAENAAERILELDANNAEAKKLLDDIKKATLVPRWRSLFNGQTIDDWEPQDPSLWKIEKENELVCDINAGVTLNIRQKVYLAGNFRVAMSFKIETAYNSSAGGVGIVIGYQRLKDEKIIHIGNDGRLGLAQSVQYDAREKQEKAKMLQTESLPVGFQKNDWNKLELEVTDSRIRIYINNKLSLEYTSPDKEYFNGEIGLWVQESRVSLTDLQYQK
ncbi:MAG: family 16 glycoside hydrolase [Candidatus Brocadiia bacterium]